MPKYIIEYNGGCHEKTVEVIEADDVEKAKYEAYDRAKQEWEDWTASYDAYEYSPEKLEELNE